MAKHRLVPQYRTIIGSDLRIYLWKNVTGSLQISNDCVQELMLEGKNSSRTIAVTKSGAISIKQTDMMPNFRPYQNIVCWMATTRYVHGSHWVRKTWKTWKAKIFWKSHGTFFWDFCGNPDVAWYSMFHSSCSQVSMVVADGLAPTGAGSSATIMMAWAGRYTQVHPNVIANSVKCYIRHAEENPGRIPTWL